MKTRLLYYLAITFLASATNVRAQTPSVTFTNPTPGVQDYFGWAVAGVGTDKVLIGAYGDDDGLITDAGAAYLFSTNGALMHTFTRPTPQANASFGFAVAAVGPDKVLIGCINDAAGGPLSGAAYLFSTNGSLLQTFINPTPSIGDQFGCAVAALGTDKVIIGAKSDNFALDDAGAAYLFSTSGALLTTFTNPAPQMGEYFGWAVAGVGTNKVLIGAAFDSFGGLAAGAAYLFSTSGTLLTTITNPAPTGGNRFGAAVAALGTDQLVIGAPLEFTDGAAFIFSTNGALQTVMTNPTPAFGDNFGISVDAVGKDKVIVGAYLDSAGANFAGAAHLLSVNGKLLVTYTNPAPQASDYFGYAVAAVGTDKVLIGAYQDDTGANESGVAYLYNIPPSAGIAPSVTLTNPAPADSDYFAFAVAGAGTDKLLIGAYADDTGAVDSGAAYLFDTNGTLLTTFNNPTPAIYDGFGSAVTALGADKVLIGAYADSSGATYAGAAYIFNTNGTLLNTITNPTPAVSDFFGSSVAAMGVGKVLIGAYQDDTGAIDAGAAYLFSTNGVLLITFTNPTPALQDYFGYSIAAIGTDKVVIGADHDDTGAIDAGAAYIFRTNGTLVITITNPAPAASEFFGYSVAAVGPDKVVIGAYGDSASAPSSGVAYLFSTNGTLLTTFTSPTPALNDLFGIAVASVGADKVLIGAFADSTSGSFAGAAYLFSTSGTLLASCFNPTPAVNDFFGFGVAAVGADKILIGAYGDDTGATNAGAAYLYNISCIHAVIPNPQLRIFRTNANAVVVAWPAPSTEWTLQASTNLTAANWLPVTNAVNVVGNENQVTISPPQRNRYFRLSNP